MANKTSATTIVNVGGSVVALLLATYGIASYMLFEAEIPGCMADYQRTATFDFTATDGALLTPIELQARAGNGERGVSENARIVPVSDAPSPAALEVALGFAAEGKGPGVSFLWRPALGEHAKSACLRYSVWLPKEFDFARGGNLPGFVGGERLSNVERPTAGFELRTKWYREGVTDFVLKSPQTEHANGQSIGMRAGSYARGRWIAIEQELRLDQPGAKDGKFRVWMDGSLIVDERRLNTRKEDNFAIDGVAANIGFVTGNNRQVPSGDAGTLRLSPIELAWR